MGVQGKIYENHHKTKRIDEALGFGNTLLNHYGRFLTRDATATSNSQAVARNVTNGNYRGLNQEKCECPFPFKL